jgi:xanthine dehydrogenase accessory factor
VSDHALYQAVVKAQREGRDAVLATVIHDQGSVPRHAGAKMLIFGDGTALGTIGGGEMESRVIAAAHDVLSADKPATHHYEFADPSRGDPGVCGGQIDVFMEPIRPDPTILIIGCGHCGQALAELAHWLGYRVIVADDRAELCNPEAIPLADEHITVPPEQIAEAAPIHSRTYIAAVTRGVPLDVAMLPALLETDAPYIGVMGSRRRWTTAVKELREAGVSEEALQRIHAPIGLELEAETPHEIAVSIMAEIIAHQRGGTGDSMKQATAAEKSS